MHLQGGVSPDTNNESAATNHRLATAAMLDGDATRGGGGAAGELGDQPWRAHLQAGKPGRICSQQKRCRSARGWPGEARASHARMLEDAR